MTLLSDSRSLREDRSEALRMFGGLTDASTSAREEFHPFLSLFSLFAVHPVEKKKDCDDLITQILMSS